MSYPRVTSTFAGERFCLAMKTVLNSFVCFSKVFRIVLLSLEGYTKKLVLNIVSYRVNNFPRRPKISEKEIGHVGFSPVPLSKTLACVLIEKYFKMKKAFQID